MEANIASFIKLFSINTDSISYHKSVIAFRPVIRAPGRTTAFWTNDMCAPYHRCVFSWTLDGFLGRHLAN